MAKMVDDVLFANLRDKLFTPGELLRQNQLAPDNDTISDVSNERQLGLFEVNGR